MKFKDKIKKKIYLFTNFFKKSIKLIINNEFVKLYCRCFLFSTIIILLYSRVFNTYDFIAKLKYSYVLTDISFLFSLLMMYIFDIIIFIIDYFRKLGVKK